MNAKQFARGCWKVFKWTSLTSTLLALILWVFFNFHKPAPFWGVISIPIYGYVIFSIPIVTARVLSRKTSNAFLFSLIIPACFLTLGILIYRGGILVPISLLEKLGYGAGWLMAYASFGLASISFLISLFIVLYTGWGREKINLPIVILIDFTLLICLWVFNIFDYLLI